VARARSGQDDPRKRAPSRRRVEFRPGGRIVRRAHSILEEAERLLETVADAGLFEALARGTFADTRRPADGGRGFDGVVAKEEGYENPFAAMAGRQAAATSP
jgi:beta-lysine 5,6-aminomutase alpha subunit